MKSKRNIIATVLAMFMVFSMVTPAFGVLSPGTYSNSKVKYHNGSHSKTGFSARLSWPNLTNKVRWSGNSYTKWYGATPYNADSIQHTNNISVSGIGSLSFNTSSAGASISGSTMSDTMSVSNSWKIESNFDYSLKKGIFITGTNFSTSGRVQIGSSFYSMSCTT